MLRTGCICWGVGREGERKSTINVLSSSRVITSEINAIIGIYVSISLR